MSDERQPSPFAFLVNGKVIFDPHEGKQRDILQGLQARLFHGQGPANWFLRGNRGSGKSKMVRSFFHAAALAIPGFRYGIIRRNMPDLRRNHLIYVGPEMRLFGGDLNETLGLARYPNGSIGFYAQCEDEKDAEKIVGSELMALFVDEAPQIKWDLLRLMAPSLRVASDASGVKPCYPLTVYGGNPIGESIEELDRYFDDRTVEDDPTYDPADFILVPIQRADNPSIDEAEYRKQFAGLPAHYRKAWLDGERMEARTLFDVAKTKDGQPYHYIQELPTIDGVPLGDVPWVSWYRAFDMGYYPDPAVCLYLAVVGKRVIVVKESTWLRTIAKDLAASMIQELKEVTVAPCVMTYADPDIDVRRGAEVTIRDHLEMAGVPIECSVNDRVLFADAIHSLLGEEVAPGVPKIQIYEPGCPMLAKYLPRMKWDEKNPRKMADHKQDHWIVALAYFALSSGVIAMTANSQTDREPLWMSWVRDATGRRKGRPV
jgi:hypothetical protein